MDPLILVAIGTVVVLGGILVFRLHAFLALFLAALIVAWLTPASNIEQYAASMKLSPQQTAKVVNQSVGQRLADGFGGTCAKIGLLIAMASILGKALLDSGSAERIVRSTLRLLGDERAGLAFLCSGFLLGIPVYFSTVFYLLIPLGKAMGIRHKRNYLLYVLSIVAGASITHSLVPPNPGPIFVASELGVDVGMMMLGGIILGIFATAAAYCYALWANRRWPVPIRETADVSLAELTALSAKDDNELPPLWLAILPVILPIILIASATIINISCDLKKFHAPALTFFVNLGDAHVALTIGAAIAIAVLMGQRNTSKKKLAANVETALSGAGIVILITAAGGAFGDILQQTGVGPRIEQFATDYRISVLPLAFLVTMLMRTAQGSANVAMITSVGIFKGFIDPTTLGFHPLYLALAIGCGSKPFSWMNDGGFWLIGKISGLTEVETLKTFSMILAILGVAGLAMIMICAKIFPMV